MKLKKVEQSTLTKTVFATLATGAIVGSILIFPSFGYIIKYFSGNNQKKYVRRVFRRLEKQELISISEDPSGKITIKLTDKGKQKALTCHLDNMKIKIPPIWDGYWRVVIFDIPENNRQARNLLREYLKKLGFYALQKSVFVHPYPCNNEVDFLKHNFNVARFVTILTAKSTENENLLRNYFQV